MALTARQIDTAKPAEKDYKLADASGLYLLVKTSGAKYWCLKYRFGGKEKNSLWASILLSPLHRRGQSVTKPAG